MSTQGTDSVIDAASRAQTFFDAYAAALLARDEQAVARMYAVPSLILFPGQSIAVSDPQQTAAFFAGNWQQYEGVDEAHADITILAATPTSIWADVTWSYGGTARERFCYQLIPSADGHQVAVLTPLAAQPDSGSAGR